MATAQKFVFSDHVILRCKFIKGDYIPTEMLDLEEFLRILKELFVEKMTFSTPEHVSLLA